ncbi:hypothetical protein ACFQH9_10060 [Pseudonocardia lutea]|uniref:Uncharacterized protein n=1 Tax=Pseudonocardia lutea TaxID=2172015 RepID=A0ABW1I694_9PSEU
MTGFRPPSVAGVSGGVGTTTLALALHGRDGGTGAGADADIVVCRSSAESLDRALRIADLFDPTAVPAVLAVTLDGAERRHPERLDELGPGWSAVVPLPHVGRWRGIVDPYREAAGLLGTPRERLPRALRPYLDAVARLARAVADSGRLGRPAPAGRPVPAPLGHAPLPPLSPLPSQPVVTRARPAPIAPHREQRRVDVPAFTSYRSFVPVGADGPLASVPRPAQVVPQRPVDVDRAPAPSGTITAAPPEPAPPVPTESLHPDLRPVRGIRILEVGPVAATNPERRE